MQFLVNKCNKLEGKLAIAKEQIRMYEEDVLKDKEKVNADLIVRKSNCFIYNANF